MAFLIAFVYFITVILSLTISYRTTFNNSKYTNISFEEGLETAFIASCLTSILLFFIELLFGDLILILYFFFVQIFIGGFLYYKVKEKIPEKTEAIKLIGMALAGNFILLIISFYTLFFLIRFLFANSFSVLF